MRCPRLVASALAVALPLGLGALAAPYEDNCVLAVSKIIPTGTSVQRVAVRPATPETVRALGRMTTWRWVQVDATLSLGGHKMTKSFICSENAEGERIVVATDRSGPGQTHDWIVR